MPKYQIIHWRDIPAQVRVKSGRSRLSRQLSPRFQKTVHRAAFRAKAINGDAYQEGWNSSKWEQRDGELEALLEVVVSELEAAYTDERLDKLALAKGLERPGTP